MLTKILIGFCLLCSIPLALISPNLAQREARSMDQQLSTSKDGQLSNLLNTLTIYRSVVSFNPKESVLAKCCETSSLTPHIDLLFFFVRDVRSWFKLASVSVFGMLWDSTAVPPCLPEVKPPDTFGGGGMDLPPHPPPPPPPPLASLSSSGHSAQSSVSVMPPSYPTFVHYHRGLFHPAKGDRRSRSGRPSKRRRREEIRKSRRRGRVRRKKRKSLRKRLRKTFRMKTPRNTMSTALHVGHPSDEDEDHEINPVVWLSLGVTLGFGAAVLWNINQNRHTTDALEEEADIIMSSRSRHRRKRRKKQDHTGHNRRRYLLGGSDDIRETCRNRNDLMTVKTTRGEQLTMRKLRTYPKRRRGVDWEQPVQLVIPPPLSASPRRRKFDPIEESEEESSATPLSQVSNSNTGEPNDDSGNDGRYVLVDCFPPAHYHCQSVASTSWQTPKRRTRRRQGSRTKISQRKKRKRVKSRWSPTRRRRTKRTKQQQQQELSWDMVTRYLAPPDANGKLPELVEDTTVTSTTSTSDGSSEPHQQQLHHHHRRNLRPYGGQQPIIDPVLPDLAAWEDTDEYSKAHSVSKMRSSSSPSTCSSLRDEFSGPWVSTSLSFVVYDLDVIDDIPNEVMEVLCCNARTCDTHPHDRYHYVGNKIIVQRLPLPPPAPSSSPRDTPEVAAFLPDPFSTTQPPPPTTTTATAKSADATPASPTKPAEEDAAPHSCDRGTSTTPVQNQEARFCFDTRERVTFLLPEEESPRQAGGTRSHPYRRHDVGREPSRSARTVTAASGSSPVPKQASSAPACFCGHGHPIMFYDDSNFRAQVTERGFSPLPSPTPQAEQVVHTHTAYDFRPRAQVPQRGRSQSDPSPTLPSPYREQAVCTHTACDFSPSTSPTPQARYREQAVQTRTAYDFRLRAQVPQRGRSQSDPSPTLPSPYREQAVCTHTACDFSPSTSPTPQARYREQAVHTRTAYDFRPRTKVPEPSPSSSQPLPCREAAVHAHTTYDYSSPVSLPTEISVRTQSPPPCDRNDSPMFWQEITSRPCPIMLGGTPAPICQQESSARKRSYSRDRSSSPIFQQEYSTRATTSDRRSSPIVLQTSSARSCSKSPPSLQERPRVTDRGSSPLRSIQSSFSCSLCEPETSPSIMQSRPSTPSPKKRVRIVTAGKKGKRSSRKRAKKAKANVVEITHTATTSPDRGILLTVTSNSDVTTDEDGEVFSTCETMSLAELFFEAIEVGKPYYHSSTPPPEPPVIPKEPDPPEKSDTPETTVEPDPPEISFKSETPETTVEPELSEISEKPETLAASEHITLPPPVETIDSTSQTTPPPSPPGVIPTETVDSTSQTTPPPPPVPVDNTDFTAQTTPLPTPEVNMAEKVESTSQTTPPPDVTSVETNTDQVSTAVISTQSSPVESVLGVDTSSQMTTAHSIEFTDTAMNTEIVEAHDANAQTETPEQSSTQEEEPGAPEVPVKSPEETKEASPEVSKVVQEEIIEEEPEEIIEEVPEEIIEEVPEETVEDEPEEILAGTSGEPLPSKLLASPQVPRFRSPDAGLKGMQTVKETYERCLRKEARTRKRSSRVRRPHGDFVKGDPVRFVINTIKEVYDHCMNDLNSTRLGMSTDMTGYPPADGRQRLARAGTSKQVSCKNRHRRPTTVNSRHEPTLTESPTKALPAKSPQNALPIVIKPEPAVRKSKTPGDSTTKGNPAWKYPHPFGGNDPESTRDIPRPTPEQAASTEDQLNKSSGPSTDRTHSHQQSFCERQARSGKLKQNESKAKKTPPACTRITKSGPSICDLFRELKEKVAQRESMQRREEKKDTEVQLVSTCSTSQQKESMRQENQVKSTPDSHPRKKAAEQKICVQIKQKDGNSSPPKVCRDARESCDTSKPKKKISMTLQQKDEARSPQKVCFVHQQKENTPSPQRLVLQPPQNEDEEEDESPHNLSLAKFELTRFKSSCEPHLKVSSKDSRIIIEDTLVHCRFSQPLNAVENTSCGLGWGGAEQVFEYQRQRQFGDPVEDSVPDVPQCIQEVYDRCIVRKPKVKRSNQTKNNHASSTVSKSPLPYEPFDENFTTKNPVSPSAINAGQGRQTKAFTSKNANLDGIPTVEKSFKTHAGKTLETNNDADHNHDDNDYIPILPVAFPFPSSGQPPSPDQDSSNSADRNSTEYTRRASPNCGEKKDEPYRSLSRASITEPSPPWEVSDRAKNNVFSAVGWTSPRLGITSLFRGQSNQKMDSDDQNVTLNNPHKTCQVSDIDRKHNENSSRELNVAEHTPETLAHGHNSSRDEDRSFQTIPQQQANNSRLFSFATKAFPVEGQATKLCSTVKADVTSQVETGVTSLLHTTFVHNQTNMADLPQDDQTNMTLTTAQHQPRIMSTPRSPQKSQVPVLQMWRFHKEPYSPFPSKPKSFQYTSTPSSENELASQGLSAEEGQQKENATTSEPAAETRRFGDRDEALHPTERKECHSSAERKECHSSAESKTSQDSHEKDKALQSSSPDRTNRFTSGDRIPRHRLCLLPSDINDELRKNLNQTRKPSMIKASKRKRNCATVVRCENIRSHLSTTKHDDVPTPAPRPKPRSQPPVTSARPIPCSESDIQGTQNEISTQISVTFGGFENPFDQNIELDLKKESDTKTPAATTKPSVPARAAEKESESERTSFFGRIQWNTQNATSTHYAHKERKWDTGTSSGKHATKDVGVKVFTDATAPTVIGADEKAAETHTPCKTQCSTKSDTETCPGQNQSQVNTGTNGSKTAVGVINHETKTMPVGAKLSRIPVSKTTKDEKYLKRTSSTTISISESVYSSTSRSSDTGANIGPRRRSCIPVAQPAAQAGVEAVASSTGTFRNDQLGHTICCKKIPSKLPVPMFSSGHSADVSELKAKRPVSSMISSRIKLLQQSVSDESNSVSRETRHIRKLVSYLDEDPTGSDSKASVEGQSKTEGGKEPSPRSAEKVNLLGFSTIKKAFFGGDNSHISDNTNRNSNEESAQGGQPESKMNFYRLSSHIKDNISQNHHGSESPRSSTPNALKEDAEYSTSRSASPTDVSGLSILEPITTSDEEEEKFSGEMLNVPGMSSYSSSFTRLGNSSDITSELKYLASVYGDHLYPSQVKKCVYCRRKNSEEIYTDTLSNEHSDIDVQGAETEVTDFIIPNFQEKPCVAVRTDCRNHQRRTSPRRLRPLKRCRSDSDLLQSSALLFSRQLPGTPTSGRREEAHLKLSDSLAIAPYSARLAFAEQVGFDLDATLDELPESSFLAAQCSLLGDSNSPEAIRVIGLPQANSSFMEDPSSKCGPSCVPTLSPRRQLLKFDADWQRRRARETLPVDLRGSETGVVSSADSGLSLGSDSQPEVSTTPLANATNPLHPSVAAMCDPVESGGREEIPITGSRDIMSMFLATIYARSGCRWRNQRAVDLDPDDERREGDTSRLLAQGVVDVSRDLRFYGHSSFLELGVAWVLQRTMNRISSKGDNIGNVSLNVLSKPSAAAEFDCKNASF